MKYIHSFNLIALYLILTCSTLDVSAASFDCKLASTDIEKMVCSDAKLSHLDEELASKYKLVKKSSSTKGKITREQLRWINKRNKCKDSACVSDAYKERISELNQVLTKSVTGSWEWVGHNDAGIWLRTRQVGSKVHFQLELNNGAPSYNSGYLDGKFELHGRRGEYFDKEAGCKIFFVFTPTEVSVDEDEAHQFSSCGFGYGVVAHDKLVLTSHKVPKMSKGDPRAGE